MKVVYDNIIFSIQNAGGISLVWYELSQRLLKKKEIDFMVIENSRVNNNIFRKILNIGSDNIALRESDFILKRYMPPPYLDINEPFIFHSSYYRTSLQKNAINITTVHDFTYEHFVRGVPKYVNYLQKALAIKNSRGIICVSENTKNDLLHFFPKTDLKKVRVIYNGVSDHFKYLDDKKLQLTEQFSELSSLKYLIFVGNRRRYKNFICAIETISRLDGFSLVIAGGGKLTSEEERLLSRFIRGRFFSYPFLNDNDLNILYNNATCLLYPSLYEGFGLPMIEAMKAGCPVLAASNSSIPEIAGQAALLVEEASPAEFSKKVILLENMEFREDVIKQGFIQANKYSWDRCATEVVQFYKEIYSSHI
jgi:glycosyltransferase involved in cell wall biosynthesis